MCFCCLFCIEGQKRENICLFSVMNIMYHNKLSSSGGVKCNFDVRPYLLCPADGNVVCTVSTYALPVTYLIRSDDDRSYRRAAARLLYSRPIQINIMPSEG